MTNINVHIIYNDILNASRLLKQTQLIREKNISSDIIILGRWNKGLPEFERLSSNETVIRIKVLKDRYNKASAKTVLWLIIISLSIIEYRIKLIYYLMKIRPGIVNCHQIIILPVSVWGKWLLNYKLIYDIHELETDVAGLGKLQKKYLIFIEWFYIKFVNRVVVVGNSIAEWYKKTYNLGKVYVVRNIPKKQAQTEQNTLLRDEFNIPYSDILFLYNGFFTIGRGIEFILAAFSKVNNQKHVVFMGYGPLENHIVAYAEKYSNVHYKSAVESGDVIKFTSGADVGFCIIENTCLSYYHSLPNKLFEYIYARIPSAVSDFPEMGDIVDKYHCGWRVSPTASAVLTFVENITRDDILQMKNSINDSVEYELSWESEKTNYEVVFFGLN